VKFYRLSYHHNEIGHCLSWHPSKQKAKAFYSLARRQAKADECDAANPIITEYDMRPTRKGIIDFLNNCTPATDNG
jgi:hypothetical protein